MGDITPPAQTATAQRTWLSPTEAAKLLEVDRSTVRRWVHKGLLPSRRTAGGQFRIDRAAVEAAVARGMIQQPGRPKSASEEDRTPPTS